MTGWVTRDSHDTGLHDSGHDDTGSRDSGRQSLTAQQADAIVRRAYLQGRAGPVGVVGALLLGAFLNLGANPLVWLSLVALAGLFAAMAAANFFRRRSPAFVVDGATVLPGPQWQRAAAFGVGASSLLGLGVGLLLTDDALGGVGPIGVGFAVALCLVAAVASGTLAVLTMTRPSMLVVDADGVSLQGLSSQSISWDKLEFIGYAPDAPGTRPLSLPICLWDGSSWLVIATHNYRHTMWVVMEWLGHYWHDAAGRRELGTEASLQRLRSIEDGLFRDDVKPTWFPPPEGGPAIDVEEPANLGTDSVRSRIFGS